MAEGNGIHGFVPSPPGAGAPPRRRAGRVRDLDVDPRTRRGQPPAEPRPRRPEARLAVLVDDQGLAERVRELAAVAGVHTGLDRPGAPGGPWPRAGLAVLDPTAARRLASTGRLPPTSTALVIVAGDTDPDAEAVAAAIAAARVVRLPSGAGWLVGALAEACEPSGREALVIAVKSCGPALGVADSGLVTAALARVVAAALAKRPAAAEPPGCLVLDADPASAGIDMRLAAEDTPGVRWPDLTGARGRLPVGFLTDHLPRLGRLSLLSGDRTARPWPQQQACDAVLASAWRSYDLAVADLGPGDTPLGDAVLERAAHVVLVAPPGAPGLAAARRWLTALAERPHLPCVHVLTVHGRHWSAEVARRVLGDAAVPVASWTPLRVGAGVHTDAVHAVPPRLVALRGGLGRACRDVLAAVVDTPTPPLVTGRRAADTVRASAPAPGSVGVPAVPRVVAPEPLPPYEEAIGA